MEKNRVGRVSSNLPHEFPRDVPLMSTSRRDSWGSVLDTICKNRATYIYCISQMRTPVMGGT